MPKDKKLSKKIELSLEELEGITGGYSVGNSTSTRFNPPMLSGNIIMLPKNPEVILTRTSGAIAMSRDF
ncbi:hypothetical protein BX659_14512 [Orenia metallireducens]|uniref:Uncharacterized protein n=1 Tax=Orenia metallireducens TaxID=1413210 RepID=A0A285IIY4_9FIRM|nr:hypothetical protein [Orenia metallireducens]PRX18136.1 hypothetical protein BX659_14512 [Orenia metallireducens]SNY46911.1 hypothetical protein SAMN06265827_14612 [Orenia metallireducens]